MAVSPTGDTRLRPESRGASDEAAGGYVSRIRVLNFADIINRHDFIHNVMLHCDTRRFDISAATLFARGSLNADPGRLRLVELGCRRGIGYAQGAMRLRRLVQQSRIHIVHSHHYKPSLIAAIAVAGLPVRLILGRHYSDAIYQLATGLRRRAYLAIEGFCNRRASVIVAPSAAVVKVLRDQMVPMAKIARIPYGFDFSLFGPRDPEVMHDAKEEWPDRPGLRLGTFARLHHEKGHRYLLQALRRLAEEGVAARLLVVGDGPERGALEAQALALGLDPLVRFTGWRTDALDLMAAADIVVQATLHEAFSQVMVEAMALGRPLVISDVSGVADVVENGASGMIVPPRDVAALAKAINHLRDPAVATAIGARAHTRVREILDIRNIVTQFESVYESVHAP